jgi:hypothetical protein
MNTKLDAALAQIEESVGPEWRDEAYKVMQQYAQMYPHFLTEDVRAFSREIGMKQAHDDRAWGPVTLKAIKNGIMARDGFELTKKSIGNPRHQMRFKSMICGAPDPVTVEALFQ